MKIDSATYKCDFCEMPASFFYTHYIEYRSIYWGIKRCPNHDIRQDAKKGRGSDSGWELVDEETYLLHDVMNELQDPNAGIYKN